MSINAMEYGTLASGEKVSQIMIRNNNHAEVRIITYGAAISHLLVPDQSKQLVDVVLGYDCLEDYERGSSAFGAVVGRHANRIKDAELRIDGKLYTVTANEGNNSLHSGPSNFIRKNFTYQIIDENTIKLCAVSPDGEEGFPGNLKLEVTYTLRDDNRIVMSYHAMTDMTTVVNITNHSYFNLNGHDSGSAMGHLLMLNSNDITENDKYSVPTGNYLSVENTPFDFTTQKVIGERMEQNHVQLIYGSGFDHNYVLKKQLPPENLEFAASLMGEKTGIIMKTYTTQPGLQLYTANHLEEGSNGKSGARYGKRCAICLETQHFPVATSNPHFPSVILRPGEDYEETTIYEFAV